MACTVPLTSTWACGLLLGLAAGVGATSGPLILLNTVTAKPGFHDLTAELVRYSSATL